MDLRSGIICYLIILPFISISQDCPTWGQIYDYDIGDVFHYEKRIESTTHYIFWDIKKIVQVMNKYYSPEEDTVYYDLLIKELSRSDQYPDWSYEEYTDLEKYRSLDLPIPCDTTYYNSLYNERRISHVYTEPYLSREDSEYVDGCGMVYNYLRMYYGKYFTFETSMVYYKKGNEQWGNPLNLTSVEDLTENTTQIILFPNPACNKISVLTKNKVMVSRMDIYNNIGNRLMSIDQEFDNINISHFPPGIYIVKIIGDDWTVNRKLIVQ